MRLCCSFSNKYRVVPVLILFTFRVISLSCHCLTPGKNLQYLSKNTVDGLSRLSLAAGAGHRANHALTQVPGE
jgi:hypothetical protein